MIERCFDLVEVLVEELLRFILERSEQGAVYVLFDPTVVEVLTRQHQIIDPELLQFPIQTSVVLDGVLERKQHFHAGQALLRSEEHTSELQSRENLVCRLLLEKK